jgi:chloramphenicol 3-O-phosphotransferase
MGNDGSSKSAIVIVTGPAGAGKTAIADCWARRSRNPTVHISLDDVRDWVKSGYTNPEDGWNEAAASQYALARRCTALAAREYVQNGYACVIDDAVFPNWPAVGLEKWQEEFLGIQVCLVVILPSFKTLLSRNADRTEHRRLKQETLCIIYNDMLGWREYGVPLIDNTDLSVEAAARCLDSTLKGFRDQTHHRL